MNRAAPTLLEDRRAVLDLLRATRTIAVVGLSTKPERDSHTVSAYLRERGYRVIGVNPAYAEVFGETCYPSLSGIPGPQRAAIDLVLVFRRPEDVPPLVEEMARLGLRRLWLQLGVASPATLQAAGEHGITVVAEKCIRVVDGLLRGS